MTRTESVSSVLSATHIQHVVIAAQVAQKSDSAVADMLDYLAAKTFQSHYDRQHNLKITQTYMGLGVTSQDEAERRMRKLVDMIYKVGLVEAYRLLPPDSIDRIVLITTVNAVDASGYGPDSHTYVDLAKSKRR